MARKKTAKQLWQRRIKQRRMAKALRSYVESVVGRGRASGAKVRKNPGGSITIIPLRANRARGRG